MNILLSGEFEAAELHAWQQSLRAVLPQVDWLDRAQALSVADSVQAAVVANPPPGSLLGLPKLRLIQSLWAGVDRLLLDPTLPAGVPIARMVDPAMNAAMAETALWATLALHRGFFGYARDQRAGLWRQHPQKPAAALQVLVLGLGQMGLAAARSRAGLPRPRLEPAAAQALGGAGRDRLPRGAQALAMLLPVSDIVINLLPLTEATARPARRPLLRRAAARCGHRQPGARRACGRRRPAGRAGRRPSAHAVLDVFHTEPLPAGHAFWSHPQVTMLPHAAALTDPRSAAAVAAANLRALARRPAAGPPGASSQRGY